MFELDGFDEMIRKIDNLDKEMEEPIMKGVFKAARRVQASAKRMAPVDKGQLRNSIIASVQTNMSNRQVEGIVSTNAEHAA